MLAYGRLLRISLFPSAFADARGLSDYERY